MKKSKLQAYCAADNVLRDIKMEPFVLIIFGGSGDLSQRKLLPALFRLFKGGKISDFSIVAIGRRAGDDKKYRVLIKNACKSFLGKDFSARVWKRFAVKLTYQSLDINDKESYTALCSLSSELLEQHKTKNLLYYLAIPPNSVPHVVNGLAQRDMCRGKTGARIVVEKPFGKDQKSAKELNGILLEAFDEKQIYRIDHFLGKETVQNILFFRFANTIFEPIWNKNYVDHVEITVSESLGVEQRGAFYEEAGVIRDMVQNHMLQLLAMIAMEPPAGFSADLIRDEKVKVFRSIRRFSAKDIENNIRVAQYGSGEIDGKKVKAYREEGHVAKDSETPTFMSGKFYVDNQRWDQVPFYLKTGKRLNKRFTEINIVFKKPPLKLLTNVCEEMQHNTLTITVQPEEKIALTFGVKRPESLVNPHQVEMVFNYADTDEGDHYSPYERLLLDCMRGDQTLFVRQDGVEAMWGVVDSIIKYWEKRLAEEEIEIYLVGGKEVRR